MKSISLAIFLVIWLAGWQAQCQDYLRFFPQEGLQDLGGYAKILEDPSGQKTIEDILTPEAQEQFVPSRMQVPNFNSTESAVWIRIDIAVQGHDPCWLEVSYPLLYELDFYRVNGAGQVSHESSGTKMPFGQRQVQHSHFFFELSPQCKTYYLRATSYEILQLPLRAGRWEDFFAYNHHLALLNGIHLGFVLLIVLYNLFLYLSTHERVYLSYVLYVTMVGLVTSNLVGYNFQFLYPDYPKLNFYTPILYPLNFFVLIFSMDFLAIRQQAPQYRRGFWVLIGICIAEILLNMAGFPHLMFKISQVVGLLVVGYILWVAGKLYLSGYRPAKFFLLAFTTFLLSIVTTILLASGAIPYSLWAYHSIQIGSAIEIVLLSFAIADKINVYKREKEAAQELALQRLQENQQMITAQKLELERRVQARTQQIEEQKEEISSRNEELLQTQEEILAQRSALEKQNEMLSNYQEQLNQINAELQRANSHLETQVAERTRSLTQANEALVRQNHQLEEYAFVTAHHLRAPVARLLGLTSVIDKTGITDEYNRLVLERMQEETEALDTIIRDLNQVLALQEDSQVLVQEISLAKAIEDVCQKLEANIQEVGATLHLSVTVSHWPVISQYFQHILYQFLTNALRFRSPDRPLYIELQIEQQQQELHLQVRDNGLGFDMAYAKDKIFGLYQRFHTDVGGKGVGLYIARIQAEHMKGRLQVESVEGQGSCFGLLLPRP